MNRGKRKLAAVAGAVALVLAAPFPPESSAMELDASPPVDLGKYTGLWYEIARTPNRFQDNTPRRDGKRLSACFNTTAEYELRRDGRIAVTNTCLRETDDTGVERDVARGVALVVEGAGNRRLQVAFGPWPARFFQRLFASAKGNYLIHCLGPEIDDRYSWSVVADNRKRLVWLLSREQEPSDDVRAEMLSCAREAELPVDKLIYTQRGG